MRLSAGVPPEHGGDKTLGMRVCIRPEDGENAARIRDGRLCLLAKDRAIGRDEGTGRYASSLTVVSIFPFRAQGGG